MKAIETTEMVSSAAMEKRVEMATGDKSSPCQKITEVGLEKWLANLWSRRKISKIPTLVVGDEPNRKSQMKSFTTCFWATCFSTLWLLSLSAGAGPTALPDGFYRYPTIGGGAIVFTSEGDLWKVPVDGGVAMGLTAFEGEENFPKLSPDGKMIAFTAQYEGNDDVYVMPASGGEPVRLTFHPAPDQALGWTADGNVLFRSRRDTPNNDYRIYKVS